MKALPEAAVRQLAKGVPADKVLMPHVQLSPRERKFVQRITEGAGKREAFVEAFEPGGTSRSVSTAAWKVAKRPEVQQALAQEKAVERLRYSQNPVQIREFLVESLQHLARTAKKEGDKLQALRLLGQLADVAAFETRSVVTHQKADTRSALRSKLERLAAIDVEARETPTLGGEGQSDGHLGGGTTSINPHEQSALHQQSPIHQQSELSYQYDTTPLESENEDVVEEVPQEVAPSEKDLGSHTGGGKKDRPIWEDPKRWYKEHIGEIEMEELLPREEARERIQQRLKE